jgi:hypothetical protein
MGGKMDAVRFRVELSDKAAGQKVKETLEEKAKDITIAVLDLKNINMQLVSGSTSQETYEKLFDAKLNYVTRTIPNLNRGPYQVQEWQEVKPASVPDYLKAYVSSISLEQRMYLTD